MTPLGVTVKRYDANGDSIRAWTVPIPEELAKCDWAPSLRLIGDDPVYGAGMCLETSGRYLVSPSGFRLIDRFLTDARADYAQMAALTQAPKWTRDSW